MEAQSSSGLFHSIYFFRFIPCCFTHQYIVFFPMQHTITMSRFLVLLVWKIYKLGVRRVLWEKPDLSNPQTRKQPNVHETHCWVGRKGAPLHWPPNSETLGTKNVLKPIFALKVAEKPWRFKLKFRACLGWGPANKPLNKGGSSKNYPIWSTSSFFNVVWQRTLGTKGEEILWVPHIEVTQLWEQSTPI